MKGAFRRTFARQAPTKRPWLRDIILGGQDGLVNVLGVVLGVAAANGSRQILLAASLAAAFAESFSMAAVAYTSGQAEEDFNKQEFGSKWQIISSPPNFFVVGLAALVASFIPILPFLFWTRETASLLAFVASGVTLFLVGAYEARSYRGNWWQHGLRMLIIGLGAAIGGFLIGKIFQVN